MDFISIDEGWLTTSGTIYHTTDGGSTWDIQYQNGSIWIDALCMLDGETGWVGGHNGLILKTSSGGEIFVAIEGPEIGNSPQIVKSYQLPQNYPNPFNPTTTIRYGLPETGQVRMTIFNLYGQKVVDLVNTTQNPGYYETIWNGKNRDGVSVSSGVYICYINVVGRTESYSKNIKMLLMK